MRRPRGRAPTFRWTRRFCTWPRLHPTLPHSRGKNTGGRAAWGGAREAAGAGVAAGVEAGARVALDAAAAAAAVVVVGVVEAAAWRVRLPTMLHRRPSGARAASSSGSPNAGATRRQRTWMAHNRGDGDRARTTSSSKSCSDRRPPPLLRCTSHPPISFNHKNNHRTRLRQEATTNVQADAGPKTCFGSTESTTRRRT